jgi:hypothetical protein
LAEAFAVNFGEPVEKLIRVTRESMVASRVRQPKVEVKQ